MALVKRENIMSRIETLMQTIHANSSRVIEEVDPLKQDMALFPNTYIQDNDSTLEALRSAGFELRSLQVKLKGVFQTLTSSSANTYIDSVKELFYNDSILLGFVDTIRFSSDSKTRVLEHDYVTVDMTLDIQYEEKVYN